MVCIDPLGVNTPFLAHKPTGLHFSCSGMSSGTGTAAGLGLVRENSFGWVVFTGAFFTWFPDDMRASWPMRRSISGRHLKVQHTSIFQFGQFSPRHRRSWTDLTWAKGGSIVFPQRQHRKSYSTLLVSQLSGLWRRKPGTIPQISHSPINNIVFL